MKRRLFTIFSAISLLLCVGIIVLRAATLEHTKCAVVQVGTATLYGAGSRGGFIELARIECRQSPAPSDPAGLCGMIVTWRNSNGDHGDIMSALGVDFFDVVPRPRNAMYHMGIRSFKVLAVSHGLLVFATAILPIAWVFFVSRRKLNLPGFEVRAASPDRSDRAN